MVVLHSIRELHSELSTVCSSLECLFRLVGSDYSELEGAALPALLRFRELLDAGDQIAGPDLPYPGQLTGGEN